MIGNQRNGVMLQILYVTFCLTKDSLPSNAVGKVDFRSLLEKLNPQYD